MESGFLVSLSKCHKFVTFVLEIEDVNISAKMEPEKNTNI